MSNIFSDFFDSFGSAFGGLFQNDDAQTPIVPRLCNELGWQIDEVHGQTIGLHFKDNNAIRGIRKVFIYEGEGLVSFRTHSHASIPENQIQPEILGHLLLRNYERGIGAWSVHIDNDGDTLFFQDYSTLKGALTANAMQAICSELVTETSEFDAKLRRARLLR
jgi:hypothetical protein